jgi:predicted LPLAT superfamily acyltransferase
LGQSLIDKAAVLSGKHTKLKFVFNGENYLEDIVKNGKGGILLSGHLGNWDVAGHFLERLHTKINIVMFDGEDRQIKQLFDGLADHKKPQIIYIKSDLSHVFEINRALESNELVCIHADRFVHGTKTLEVPFFGEKAKFPEGPFLLALKMKKPVVFVYAVKNAIFSYELSSTPIMNFSVNNGDTLDTVATAYSMLLEKMTRRYPHQWFNYYDFWRTS